MLRYTGPLPLPVPDYNDGSRVYTTIPRRYPGDKPHHEYSECALAPAMYRRIQNTPNFPQPVSLPVELQPTPGVLEEKLNAVEVKPVVGKGQGIFTRRDIPMGTFLFAERPLLVASAGIPIPSCRAQAPGLPVSDEKRYMRNLEGQHYILERAVSRMLPANQQAFMALANVFSSDTQINGIAQTNVCDLEEDISELHGLLTIQILMSNISAGGEYLVGVFDVASRFNHR